MCACALLWLLGVLGVFRSPRAVRAVVNHFGYTFQGQGSKVCAKFPDSMIFREKTIRTGLSGGAAGRPDGCPDFCFAGPVVGWPVQIVFSHGRAARGLVQIFFRGWQPSWEFSYRESLIGRAPPACCRPVWGLSGFCFVLRENNPDRAESSQGQRPG